MSKLDKLRGKIKTTGLDEALLSFENKMDDITKQAIIEVKENPSKENITKAVEIIINDTVLYKADKDQIINHIKIEFIDRFNFDNCPEDYEELKKEAKFLAGMTQYSFLLMAQRLQSIKLFELYKKDGYPDFKAFIDHELNVSKSTVYRYIDILSFFGVAALQLQEIDYSKLIPVLPVLKKALINEKEREAIKNDYLKKAKNESFRDITKDAKELKIKYGLEKETHKEDVNVKRIQEFTNYIKDIKEMSESENIFIKILKNEIDKLYE